MLSHGGDTSLAAQPRSQEDACQCECLCCLLGLGGSWMRTARWQRGKLSWLSLLLGLRLPGMAPSPGDFTSLSLMGLASTEPVTSSVTASTGDQGSLLPA